MSACLTGGSASPNQVEYQNYQRHDQQDVNQPAGGVGGEHPESPQNHQNHEKCPEHILFPRKRQLQARGQSGELGQMGSAGQLVYCRSGKPQRGGCRICTENGSYCMSNL